MSITDEMMGPGSGRISLSAQTPTSVTMRVARGGASWVIVTSTYPGEGMVISREVLGELSGGRPMGGLVDRVTSNLEVELTGWSSILTGPDALDVGLIENWWDSVGARGLGWWLERICGRAIDQGDLTLSHVPAFGRWLEAGSLLPNLGDRELACSGGWRTRIDGLNMAASVLGFVWWTELQDGRPRICVDASDSLPDITLSWLVSTMPLSAGLWGVCPMMGGGTTTVRALAAESLDYDVSNGEPDSATAVVGGGDGAEWHEYANPPRQGDVDGIPMPRWKLTSAPEGDSAPETAANLQTATGDAVLTKGSDVSVRLPEGTLLEQLPPLNGAVALHDPKVGADFGVVGIDAAAVPAMAVGPSVVGTIPAFRCIRRTVPIIEGMGVWHIRMGIGDEGQTVTDLTPWVVMESGGPTIEVGVPPRPELREQILGARGGVTIVG